MAKNPTSYRNDEVHHEDREDLVFGLPEIAEEPFPPSPSHGSPGEASQEAQAVSHTLSWHEEEHTTAVSDLDLEPPEFAEAPYPPSVPTSGFQQTNTQIQTEFRPRIRRPSNSRTISFTGRKVSNWISQRPR